MAVVRLVNGIVDTCCGAFGSGKLPGMKTLFCGVAGWLVGWLGSFPQASWDEKSVLWGGWLAGGQVGWLDGHSLIPCGEPTR